MSDELVVTLAAGDQDPAAESAHALPTVARHHYEIGEEIARGGWGKILRAYDRRLERTVAIKQLRVASDAVEVSLRREASITARLEHPAIVPVHEVGRSASGELFYAMKLVEGRSLADLFDEAESLDRRLVLLPNLLAVVDAIAYAHARSIIHRDLKPRNVMVGMYGETVVIDWGLALELSEEAQVGVVGTPPYLPPEQARGERVDERADVYALGAMLYELISGERPYRGDDGDELIAKIIAEPPAPIDEPGAPPALVAIATRAMARDAAARYASASELAADLRAFLSGRLVGAHHYSSSERAWHWIAEHKRLVIGAALGLVALAAVAIGVSRYRTEHAIAEARSADLVVARARAELRRDPTAAIVALVGHDLQSPEVDEIIADARSRGIASHVAWNMKRTSISADGTFVVGFFERKIRVVALDDRRQPLLELANDDPVEHLRISPDNVHFATVSAGTVREWDRLTGTSRILWHDAPRLVWIAYRNDGRALAFSDATGRVHALDLATGTLVTRKGKGAHQVLTYCDGNTIVVSSEDGELAFRDGIATPERIGPPSLEWVACPPTGPLVAWGTIDGEVLVHDLATGAHRVLGKRSAAAVRLEWSPDGSHLATANMNGEVLWWTVATGEALTVVPRGAVAVRLAVSADGGRVAAGKDDGTIRVWDVASDARLVLTGHTRFIARIQFSADGKTLVSSDEAGQTRVWPLPTIGDAVAIRSLDTIESVAAAGGTIAWRTDLGVSVFHDGATSTLAGAFSQFELDRRGAFVATFDGKRVSLHGIDDRSERTFEVSDRFRSLRIAPAGDLMASGDDKNDIWIYGNGAPRRLHGHSTLLELLEFSADGKRLVSTARDEAIAWSRDGTLLGRMVAPEHISEGAVSRDGSHFAFALGDARVFWWTIGEPSAHELARHGSQVTSLVLSDDHLVTITDDLDAWNYDLATGEATVLHHAAPVTTAAMLADGKLATAGLDGAVHVWDLASSRKLGIAHAGDRPILRLSSDGRSLFAVSDQIWRVAPSSLTPKPSEQLTTVRTGTAHPIATPGLE